jgi:hypothetical protein
VRPTGGAGGSIYFKPQVELLPSLGLQSEVVINLSGAQGYIPYVTDEWLYFSGSIASTGVFRARKVPDTKTETIIEGFLTNIGNFHSENGTMYLLSEQVLYRWPEAEPARIERFDLEEAHFRFKSDAEHFYAITYSSQAVTLFDKQTLAPHTIPIEPLTSGGGGVYDVVSDGERLYCTRLDRPGKLYVVDKKSEKVTRLELAPFDEAPSAAIAMGGFFAESLKLFGFFEGFGYYGYIDTVTGRSTALAAPNGWREPGPVLREPDSPWSYFVDRMPGGNVYRFDREKLVAQPMLPLPSGLWPSHGITMDATHVYFVTIRDGLTPNAPVGILRVAKPSR